MNVIDFHNHIILPDTEGERLLGEMDANNVQRTLLMGCPTKYWDYVGDNEQVSHLVSRYPDRLLGGCYVDPLNMAEATETISEYHEKGFVVVKMFPCLGYYPDDDAIMPLYELILKLRMMVLFHMGGASTQLFPGDFDVRDIRISVKYGRSQYIDMIAHRFPELRIVMAHMGMPDYEEAAYMTSNHRNVYVDCSSTAFAPVFKALHARSEFLFKPLNFKRILWGLDATPNVYGPRIAATQELMKQLGWEEHIPDVFHDNAAALCP